MSLFLLPTRTSAYSFVKRPSCYGSWSKAQVRFKFTIGIRREDKGRWERRVPLTPAQVSQLRGGHHNNNNHGTTAKPEILVQPSTRRIFSDEEFRRVISTNWGGGGNSLDLMMKAGAVVQEDLSAADVILGVKEVPPGQLLANKGYLFFSHTHKGQPHNMKMLDDILRKVYPVFGSRSSRMNEIP